MAKLATNRILALPLSRLHLWICARLYLETPWTLGGLLEARPRRKYAKTGRDSSHENGPCIVAMAGRALPSRRLKHGTPDDGVQRVGPVEMLYVACPTQSKPDGHRHRMK